MGILDAPYRQFLHLDGRDGERLGSLSLEDEEVQVQQEIKILHPVEAHGFGFFDHIWFKDLTQWQAGRMPSAKVLGPVKSAGGAFRRPNHSTLRFHGSLIPRIRQGDIELVPGGKALAADKA